MTPIFFFLLTMDSEARFFTYHFSPEPVRGRRAGGGEVSSDQGILFFSLP